MTRLLLVLATSAGGVGRHVAELASGLTPADDVLVAGPVNPGSGFAFEPVEIAVRPRPLADVAAIARLRSLMRGRDVVHAHGLRAGALAGLSRTTLRRRPALVVTLHNALVSQRPGRGIAAVHRVLETIVARTAGVVLVVSSDIGDAMQARGARDVRPASVPAPPLPPARRAPSEVRASLGIPDGTRLLLSVARLAPQKALDVLVDAAALLSGQRVQVVVAGEGPLRPELIRRIEVSGAPVRLLGHRDDVADLIGSADLVLLPSRWEGQPLIAQEALRAGAALIATDAGGTAELVGDGALLIPPGRPEALAGAVTALLGDPPALAGLRARARKRGEQLPRASDALQQVCAVYAEVTHPG